MPRNKPIMVEVLCQNPDHDAVHGGERTRHFMRPVGRGKPRLYCSPECRHYVAHYFRRDDIGALVRITRDAEADNRRPSTLSLDLVISTAKGKRTLLDYLADPNAVAPDKDPNLMPASVNVPLASLGFPGIVARLTYQRPAHPFVRVLNDPNVDELRHDHVEVDITLNGQRVLTDHPQAPAIADLFASGALNDYCHNYLEGLRVAAATGFTLDGPGPVIEPEAANAHLLERPDVAS